MAGTPANHDCQELELKHRVLDREVSRLSRRAYLTPDERHLVTELKKEKLKTKDRLAALRRGDVG